MRRGEDLGFLLLHRALVTTSDVIGPVVLSNTPVLVAVIGGVVTLGGFIISGVFGLITSSTNRSDAASAGVEKALNERLQYKDEMLEDCRAERDRFERERDERTEERDQARVERQSRDLLIWDLKREVRELKRRLGVAVEDGDEDET